MKTEYKKQALSQLKRAEGMIKKVISMVDEDRYCIDVLQQSLAAIGLTKSANKVILENHLNSCFKEGMANKSIKKRGELIEELMRIINKV
jgi:DNA-binding FrmR family transcriptional regulator